MIAWGPRERARCHRATGIWLDGVDRSPDGAGPATSELALDRRRRILNPFRYTRVRRRRTASRIQPRNRRGGKLTTQLTARGAETRDRIVDAALELVREAGYDGASMRSIAKRADVSLGSSYYYFPSKDHLIQGFYRRVHRHLAAGATPILARERSLEARIRGVMEAWLEAAEPYHDAAIALFRAASDPKSPLNPLSQGSTKVREDMIAVYRLVVEGSNAAIPIELRDDLPAFLWTAHLGVMLFWIHDTSPDRARTRSLIDALPGLLARLVFLSRLPGLGDLRRQIRFLLDELATQDR